jgi:hypothetical protein
MATAYLKRPDDVVIFKAPEGFVTEDGSDPSVKMTFETFVKAMLQHKKMQTPVGLAHADAIEIALERCPADGYLMAPKNALSLLADCAKNPDFLIPSDGGQSFAKIYPFQPEINRKIQPFVEACQKLSQKRPEPDISKDPEAQDPDPEPAQETGLPGLQRESDSRAPDLKAV